MSHGAASRTAETQLLGELAVEGRARRFAGLELAAGKFPVAGVRLAGGALRQQHAAVRALEDRGGDLAPRGLRSRAPALTRYLLRSPAAPA